MTPIAQTHGRAYAGDGPDAGTDRGAYCPACSEQDGDYVWPCRASCFECGHAPERHELLSYARPRGLCDARRCDCIEYESPPSVTSDDCWPSHDR